MGVCVCVCEREERTRNWQDSETNTVTLPPFRFGSVFGAIGFFGFRRFSPFQKTPVAYLVEKSRLTVIRLTKDNADNFQEEIK